MSAESQPVVDEDAKETVRELVKMVNDLQSEVKDLQEANEEKDEKISKLESRLDDQETKGDIRDNRLDSLVEGMDRQELAVSELQVRALRDNATLSKDTVNPGIIEDDLGVEVEEVYDGDAIRAADADNGVNAKGALPTEDLVEIEENRQLLRREIIDPEQLGDRDWKKIYRAVYVWDNFEMACNEPTSETWQLPSSKVRTMLKQMPDDVGNDKLAVSDDSLPMITGRVMETLSDLSDGLLDVKLTEANEKMVHGTPEEIKEAKQPLHRTTEVSDNTVVTPE